MTITSQSYSIGCKTVWIQSGPSYLISKHWPPTNAQWRYCNRLRSFQGQICVNLFYNAAMVSCCKNSWMSLWLSYYLWPCLFFFDNTIYGYTMVRNEWEEERDIGCELNVVSHRTFEMKQAHIPAKYCIRHNCVCVVHLSFSIITTRNGRILLDGMS